MIVEVGNNDKINNKGNTWPEVLKHNYEKYGDKHIAMRQKQHGIWQNYTWKDYYLNVKYLALGLSSFGFEPGDKVLIIGENAPQWYYAELAAQANHGISVGVYSDLTPAEIKYIAENSQAAFAIVEDQEQIDKFLQIKNELPLLKKIIFWRYKGLSHYDEFILIGYRELTQSGHEYEEKHPGAFEQSIATLDPDDTCAIVYTSGTTGSIPKGVVHTYKTMKPGAEYLLSLDPWYENDNVVFNLPPAWMTEQWLGIGCHLLSGSILNFAEETETQQQDIREIGPDIIYYGTRLWELQASMVQARIQGADAFKRFVYRLFMPSGYKMAESKYKKQKPGLLMKIYYLFGYLTLFRPLRDSLGMSNVRISYTSGTVISSEVISFYHALNIPLKNIYCSTEAGVLTGVMTDDISPDTLGTIHEGIEVKVTDDGELICRQPGLFVGYYQDQAKTAETFKDGWFYTGDIVKIDSNGYVTFIDRMKDIIELKSGEKLTPQLIESKLRFSPYIKDAWVVTGPDKAYVSAIIIIDYDNVGRWADRKRVAYTTFNDLSQKPEVYALINQVIIEINNGLATDSKIKKYVNLNKEFDPDEGELTRTRKLRRNYLVERYHDLINAIYSNKTEIPVEANIRYRDGRTGTMRTTININTVKGDG